MFAGTTRGWRPPTIATVLRRCPKEKAVRFRRALLATEPPVIFALDGFRDNWMAEPHGHGDLASHWRNFLVSWVREQSQRSVIAATYAFIHD